MCSWTKLAVLVAVGFNGAAVFGQQAAPTAAGRSYRALAPGVLKSVEPGRQLRESFSRHDIVELLAVNPTFDWAKDRSFRHDVWTLEFRFKPMRMVWVDVPRPGGYMEPKRVWYMVYCVTNRAIEEKTLDPNDPEPPPKYGWLHPVEAADGTFKIQCLNGPIRFVPEFLLESPEFNTVQPDRFVPVAMGMPGAPGPIWKREDPNRRFFNTTEISQGRIAVGKTAWGIVMWDNVNPQVDRFSVYVKGLTNAYKWQDQPGEYKKGARPGSYRRLLQKTLKLNFWRPGDEYDENEREIRYGIPGEVDYEWVYR